MATRVGRYAYTANAQERASMLMLWKRELAYANRCSRRADPYRVFRKRFTYNTLMGCWLGSINSVTYGIESDGYCHT